MPKVNIIRFHIEGEYPEFSNAFTGKGFTVGGVTYASSAKYFKVRKESDALVANEGHPPYGVDDLDPEEFAMMEAIYYKFTTHEDLRKILLKTYPNILISLNIKDNLLETEIEQETKNLFGLQLMALRETLRAHPDDIEKKGITVILKEALTEYKKYKEYYSTVDFQAIDSEILKEVEKHVLSMPSLSDLESLTKRLESFKPPSTSTSTRKKTSRPKKPPQEKRETKKRESPLEILKEKEYYEKKGKFRQKVKVCIGVDGKIDFEKLETTIKSLDDYKSHQPKVGGRKNGYLITLIRHRTIDLDLINREAVINAFDETTIYNIVRLAQSLNSKWFDIADLPTASKPLAWRLAREAGIKDIRGYTPTLEEKVAFRKTAKLSKSKKPERPKKSEQPRLTIEEGAPKEKPTPSSTQKRTSSKPTKDTDSSGTLVVRTSTPRGP